MPENGYELYSHDEVLSLEEFALAAEKFSRVFSVNKVRLTGGEPLIKRNIEFLVRQLSQIPGITDLAMTTNGILLGEKGQAIYDAGLRRLNISIDTLDPVKFRKITRIGNLDNFMEGIREAKRIGFSPIKINTVLLPGFNEESAIIEWANTEGFLPRFIELMPGQPLTCDLEHDQAPKLIDIVNRIESKFGKIERVVKVAEATGDHAIRFKIPDRNWTFEIIPSVTSHFCNLCNRIRLNCIGILRFCLYSDETLQIRPLLNKSDEEFAKAIVDFLMNKKNDRHGQSIASYMFSIGG